MTTVAISAAKDIWIRCLARSSGCRAGWRVLMGEGCIGLFA
jgi:hypothetical protein